MQAALQQLEQIRMRYRLGPLEFDAVSGDLQVEGQCRRLAPQPAAVLSLLLDREGGLVQRAEFTAAIWPGEAFGVSERLTYCLHQLRRTLAELGLPNLIETVPRRGYRCRIAETVVMADELPVVEVAPGAAEVMRITPRGRLWRTAIAAGIAALILTGLGLRNGLGVAPQQRSVTASTAVTTAHSERHAARHAARHVVR